jgi:hypothetical protein
VITLLANVTAFGPNPLLWAPAAVASAMLLHITAILNDIVLVRSPSAQPLPSTCVCWELAPALPAPTPEDTRAP